MSAGNNPSIRRKSRASALMCSRIHLVGALPIPNATIKAAALGALRGRGHLLAEPREIDRASTFGSTRNSPGSGVAQESNVEIL
jgi:hypothetical protein